MASHQGDDDFSEDGEFVDAASEYMEMPELSPMAIARWRTLDRTGEPDSLRSRDYHDGFDNDNAASLTREVRELRADMSRLRDLHQSTPVRPTTFDDAALADLRRLRVAVEDLKERQPNDFLTTPRPTRITNPFSPGYVPILPPASSPIENSPSESTRKEKIRLQRDIIPETYNGKTSLDDYITHFKMCWRRNRWTEDEAAETLASCLRGDAVRILKHMKEGPTYKEIEEELKRRFGHEEQTKVFLLELRARRRLQGESLKDLAQSIRDLTGKAYPKIPREYREEIAKEAFIEAIEDPDIRNGVFRADTTSLDDSVKAALEAEAFYKMERARRPAKYSRAMAAGEHQHQELDPAIVRHIDNTISQYMAPIASALDSLLARQPSGPITCYGCGQPGHKRNVCPNGKGQKQKNGRQPTQAAEGRLESQNPAATAASSQ